ncbi:Microsomal glutathione S-transferase 3 [Boothiomyces sp. JEL0838]|nr:Microsomal glutathione S-transferase 3 [Boothiomyces sp. JEL0838]
MILQLVPEHGYVILVLIGTVFTLLYLGAKVGGARRKANVAYPNMYATAEEAEKDKMKHLFNCAQRAHQNTLENIPGFLILLLVSAIEYPLISAISGAVYLASRVAYAGGYCTGDPKKRSRGFFGYFALLAMLGASGATAFKLLTQ